MVFRCPICGREFDRLVSLATHVRKFHPEVGDLIPKWSSRWKSGKSFLEALEEAVEKVKFSVFIRR